MTNSKSKPTAKLKNSNFRELNERDILLNTRFYQKIKIDSFFTSDILNFLTKDSMIDDESQKVIFDTYCPKCKKESTFKDLYTLSEITSTNLHPKLDLSHRRIVVQFDSEDLNEHVYVKEYVCSRNHSHVYSFYFSFDGKHLTKVGQTLPPTALFAMESKKYEKHFPDIQKELFTSMKLYSDSIGAAAILYLRRIFEKLINTASSEYLTSHPEDEAKIRDARMVERIEILKDLLPRFIVDNKSMYSILSIAVHELEEDLCLSAYPFIKDSILLILDQEIERILEKKREDTLKKDLNAFNSFLGSKKET